MKTVRVDGEDVIVLRERGAGDGGEVVQYLILNDDGTYTGFRYWWDDPALAKVLYDAEDLPYMRWVVGEARRRLKPIGPAAQGGRGDPAPRPIVPTVRDAVLAKQARV